MLPLLQHSGVDGFTNSINDSMADGGPTVRQHLQQQQAVQRQRQQHEAMVRRLCQQQKDGSVTGWSGGAGAQEKLQQQTLAARKRFVPIIYKETNVTTFILDPILVGFPFN